MGEPSDGREDRTKIVSVSLFGERAAGYAQGLKPFVRGHHHLFPRSEGWSLRVHVDEPCFAGEMGSLLRRYERAGVCQITVFAPEPLCRGMIRRVMPVFEEGVEYVFCRDLDGPPMPRDKACCTEFFGEGAMVHTIHDAEAHCGVMGGLCGFWAPKFRTATGMRSFDDLVGFGNGLGVDWSRHGADQVVLNHLVAAHTSVTLLEHRYSGWHAGPGKNPSRPPGGYPCGAISRPLPNGDGGPADRIGNHLGCAGYDYDAGARFWDVHGDPEVGEWIRGCES